MTTLYWFYLVPVLARIPACAGSTTGVIKYVTICNKLDNALSREPEVMIIIDGYIGIIHPFPISKIKKI